MSDSPTIVSITRSLQDNAKMVLHLAGSGRMLVVLEMPTDYAMCREIGGDVDLCDPGFEAEVIASLARAGIEKAGAAGIEVLREQRDEARAQVVRVTASLDLAAAELEAECTRHCEMMYERDEALAEVRRLERELADALAEALPRGWT